MLNATAAIAVAYEEKFNKKVIINTMYNFQGVERRLNCLGKYSLSNINGKNGTVILIDDYGHHPTAIDTTINTIRNIWLHKRLIMIFEPHRYTRIKNLYHKFIISLSNVDVLLVLEIYSANEKKIKGINSNYLCKDILKYGKLKPILIIRNNIKILSRKLLSLLKDQDLILIQGAGIVSQLTQKLFKKIKFKI